VEALQHYTMPGDDERQRAFQAGAPLPSPVQGKQDVQACHAARLATDMPPIRRLRPRAKGCTLGTAEAATNRSDRMNMRD